MTNIHLYEKYLIPASVLFICGWIGGFLIGGFDFSAIMVFLCVVSEIFFLVLLRRNTNEKIVFLSTLLVTLFGMHLLLAVPVLGSALILINGYFLSSEFFLHLILAITLLPCFCVFLYMNPKILKDFVGKDLRKYYTYGCVTCGTVFVFSSISCWYILTILRTPFTLLSPQIVELLLVSEAGGFSGFGGVVYYLLLLIRSKS